MNSIQTRTITTKQYFEIRNALNLANSTKNIKTELLFELRENEEEYYVIIKSSGAKNGLRLASFEKEKSEWVIFNNETYSHFYKYMFKKIFILNPHQSHENINELLTDWLLKLWII